MKLSKIGDVCEITVYSLNIDKWEIQLQITHNRMDSMTNVQTDVPRN